MYAGCNAVIDFPIYLIIAIAFLAIWSIVWKGLALWKSAKKNHLAWFVVLLLINTAGILEILYIYIFSKSSTKSKQIKKKKR